VVLVTTTARGGGRRPTPVVACPHAGRAERRNLLVDRFASAAEFREFFARHYGPTIAAYRNVADDPERTEALDRALDQRAAEHGADTGTMQWECLLVVATVA
jgi:hypothetical protein